MEKSRNLVTKDKSVKSTQVNNLRWDEKALHLITVSSLAGCARSKHRGLDEQELCQAHHNVPPPKKDQAWKSPNLTMFVALQYLIGGLQRRCIEGCTPWIMDMVFRSKARSCIRSLTYTLRTVSSGAVLESDIGFLCQRPPTQRAWAIPPL